MPNGTKHKTQTEHFKAQAEALGAIKVIVSWTRHDFMIGFEYDGELHRVRQPLANSAVQTDHQFCHCLTVALGYLQTLRNGAVWTCKKES